MFKLYLYKVICVTNISNSSMRSYKLHKCFITPKLDFFFMNIMFKLLKMVCITPSDF